MTLVVKKPRQMKTRPVRRRSSKKRSRRTRLAKTGVRSFGPPDAKNVSILEQAAVGINTRTWGATNMMRIPWSTTNNNNARCSNQAHVSGMLHVMTIRNLLAVPIRYYEYWVIPKIYNPLTISDALLQDDFYTAHGFVIDKDRVWTPLLPSYLYNEPVNPDKYTVLKKRITNLAPRTGSSGSYPMGLDKSERHFKTYIPVGRKYNYGSQVTSGVINDGEPDIPIEPPIFYISFCIDTITATNTAVTTNAVFRELHMVTFFRDGESGM